MAMIKVYDANEKLFNHNGIKILHPEICELTKKDNGDYYLEIRDSIDNVDYYQKGMIIRVSTMWGEQAFRCTNPVVSSTRVDVKAWHVFYDSMNYLIKDANIVDKTCNYAMNHVNSSTDIPSPFTTLSDITKQVSTRIVRKTLYDTFVEFIDESKFGGHLVRDNFNVSIMTSIGQDRGVVLADKKNITSLKVEEKWDDVCTKVLPYTTDGEVAILLDDTYVSLDSDIYDIPYSKVVKFENELEKGDFESEDAYLTATKEWLQSKAVDYLEQNKLPKVNYSVEANINNVSDVGDIIHVKHPRCKVNITTNVIAIQYDCIREKIIKVEFGNFKKDISTLQKDIVSKATEESKVIAQETQATLSAELEKATSNINSLLKESYVIYNGDQILVVDRLPKEEAKNVIRVNSAGIGFSQTGIYGTFNSAWSIDGTLNMQSINVINLTADLIKGGTLVLGGINNTSGTIELYDNSNRMIANMDKGGLTIYATNGDYVKLNGETGFSGYNSNNEKIYWADGSVFHMKNAEVENEIKISGKIKIVPVSTNDNVGVGFVAISEV